MEKRRRIVMFNRVSADGYFASTDGKLDWVVPDDEIDSVGAGSTSGFDTILFGRRTYDMFESFWPRVVNGSTTAPDPHADGRRSAALRSMGVWINEAVKLVFSKTRERVTWKNSRLLRGLDPGEIESLKRGPGKDIIIFGSGTVVSRLTEEGLIDEYQFIVGPVVLGTGKSLIANIATRVRLELLEAKRFPSGNVMLRYGAGGST